MVVLHEPSEGDNTWSLGCRAYARICFALTEASKDRDWLTVIDDAGNRFEFAVGGVAFRFYRGDPDAPPSRTLRETFPEIRQRQLALLDVSALDEIWRIAVETNVLGETERVTAVQLDERGVVQIAYEIPPDEQEKGGTISPFVPRREGPKLPPPPVGPPASDEKKKKKDDSEPE